MREKKSKQTNSSFKSITFLGRCSFYMEANINPLSYLPSNKIYHKTGLFLIQFISYMSYISSIEKHDLIIENIWEYLYSKLTFGEVSCWLYWYNLQP